MSRASNSCRKFGALSARGGQFPSGSGGRVNYWPPGDLKKVPKYANCYC